MRVCVYVCACMYACLFFACACVCVRIRAHVCVCVCVCLCERAYERICVGASVVARMCVLTSLKKDVKSVRPGYIPEYSSHVVVVLCALFSVFSYSTNMPRNNDILRVQKRSTPILA